jgi:hypothetical protein
MRLKRGSELTAIDALQAVLACLLIYWTHRYAGGGIDPLAVVSGSLIGFGFLVTAFARVGADPAGQDVAVLVLGLGALLSPFLLGFADVSGAKGMHVKVGLVLLFTAVLGMAARYLDPPRASA